MVRCLFIQYEISCCYMDDFEVLPVEHMVGRVYKPVSAAYQRQCDAWFLTH